MLTGKCKTDFEKWYFESNINKMGFIFFQPLPFSMQYGVYVDFFDNVGIEIEISNDIDYEYNKSIGWVWYIEGIDNNTWQNNRNEAREQAIKKANEIYNEKKSVAG